MVPPNGGGGPAIHHLHGEPVAINAGTWMYFWPLDFLGRLGLAASRELALRRTTTRTLLDCHFGQALDLSARVPELSPAELPAVVRTITALKTGRLMELAAVVGAVAAGGAPSTIEALGRFGHDLGVGLQMLDDLGNLTGRAAPSKRHEDLRHGRATWPWAWAAETLDPDENQRLVREQARLLATPAPDRAGLAEPLAAQLRAAVGGHGRLQAHWHLDQALAALRGSLEAPPAPPQPGAPCPSIAGRELLAAVQAELSRLETCYG
jgi:geranylgeranyl pyrophosphate synthase